MMWATHAVSVFNFWPLEDSLSVKLKVISRGADNFKVSVSTVVTAQMTAISGENGFLSILESVTLVKIHFEKILLPTCNNFLQDQ